MSGAMDYTANEMMTIAAARALRNSDICFVGIGMMLAGGRSVEGNRSKSGKNKRARSKSKSKSSAKKSSAKRK